MSEQLPDPEHRDPALSAASVRFNSNSVSILIFGAGRGGMAMLEVLRQYSWIKIHAIVDMDAAAPAFALAEELDILVSTDINGVLESFHGEIIIDVTGNPQMGQTLALIAHEQDLELISGNSAKLMFDLVNGQIHNKQTIRAQNTRLDMLDSMLDISRRLENRPPLSEIANKSFEDLHGHVEAVKGMSIIFRQDGDGEVIGAIGVDKPCCDHFTCIELNAACNDLDESQMYTVLSQAIEIKCTKPPSSYNIILPLWQQSGLAGALLFDIDGDLSHEQQTVLNMASIHLNMTVRALDHYQRLEDLATMDGLTGTFNRRHFDQTIKEEINRLQRSKQGTLSCAFIDIDEFKQVNDLFGHPVGDEVLIQVAECISRCIRDYDTCARYGGDEFVVLLPSLASESLAFLDKIGNRILQCVSAVKLADAEDYSITVSIGIATQTADKLDEKKLIAQADHAVYQAKKAGKSCLRIYSESIS